MLVFYLEECIVAVEGVCDDARALTSGELTRPAAYVASGRSLHLEQRTLGTR